MPLSESATIWEERKRRVSGWLQSLQNDVCAAFEALEDELAARAPPGPEDPSGYPDMPAGRFIETPTRRKAEAEDEAEDGGGGRMCVMRGRLFEKVGVNFSEVYGGLSPESRKALTARREIPGLAEDPRFWAAGVSLVAHMRSPRAPITHMNVRLFWTPTAAWFGGGADLTPTVRRDDPAWREDAEAYHVALEACCARHDPTYYPRFKEWADSYFRIRHRGETRGAGGIFFDDLNSGDWDADFAFIRDVGRVVVTGFSPLVRKRMLERWTAAEQAHQLERRGRYVEFNLVYDRGTRFGLASGHNADAVLMSLPPRAAWP